MSNRRSMKPAKDGQDLSPLASAQDFINMKFLPSPDDWEVLIGSRAEWVKRAGDDYPSLRLGAASLKKDDVGITAMVRAVGGEPCLELVEHLQGFANAHRAISEVVESMVLRMMVGLHRVAAEEAAEARSS